MVIRWHWITLRTLSYGFGSVLCVVYGYHLMDCEILFVNLLTLYISNIRPDQWMEWMTFDCDIMRSVM